MRALTPDPEQVLGRIQALLGRYGGETACAAYMLCDRHNPGAVAYQIVSADLSSTSIRFEELRAESQHVAVGLRNLGVGRGDRVATLMGKSRDYLVTVLAIWRLGAVHVPLFTAFAPPAIAYRLDGSAAKVVIADTTQAPKLAPGGDIPDDPGWRLVTTGAASDEGITLGSLKAEAEPELEPVAIGGDAPIIMIYTSGTTGPPKGVEVPLRALASFHAYAEFGLDLREDDVYWCAADPGWAYGLYYGVLAPLATGAYSVMLEGGFSAESTIEVLRKCRVTNFAAAPTVYRALRASKKVSPGELKLRCASSAGEPLTPDVNAWAESALGVAVRDHYGQTETGMLINNHHHELLLKPIKPGSMGHSMPGWRAAVLAPDTDAQVDAGHVGRLAVDLSASPLAWFRGYAGDEERSAAKFTSDESWYLTGDMASLDEEGYFHFSSRDDDVIIMAGYRIGPFEVESTLAQHPAVHESAVIAVPDEIRGEIIEAFVVLSEGFDPSAGQAVELQEWVKSKFARHAFPRRIHFVDDLPKTPSGKVQRFMLRNRRTSNAA